MSMEIWTKVAQFFMSLSLLIILHELGHFTLAKLFKTRVEKFYLFFDPWFSLFKFKRGDTEYGIGWLPLGGYVKISGMIDESMDTEQLKSDPEPWEFRAKPTCLPQSTESLAKYSFPFGRWSGISRVSHSPYRG